MRGKTVLLLPCQDDRIHASRTHPAPIPGLLTRMVKRNEKRCNVHTQKVHQQILEELQMVKKRNARPQKPGMLKIMLFNN
jgi:hypothetical protein